MVIKILGTGCAKCKTLEANARAAILQAGAQATVEKVTDLKDIMGFGVLVTPALVVDGVVKSAGKALSPAEISAYLK